MSGYARVQELRAKLKPFRKYSGHYIKSPDTKHLLQENMEACSNFMTNRSTNELSTINSKVLLQWAECAYALARKFDEKRLLYVSCEKYELVAKNTGPQDDFLVYCKWAIVECEKSLLAMFYKDGRGKKGTRYIQLNHYISYILFIFCYFLYFHKLTHNICVHVIKIYYIYSFILKITIIQRCTRKESRYLNKVWQ